MGDYVVSVLTRLHELDALLPEWLALFIASGIPNPFAHPLWLATWARHFVRDGDLYALAVRDQSGALMGLAPFYRRRHRLGLPVPVRQLQLLGAGRRSELTELPQVLAGPGLARPVLRAVVHELVRRAAEWDWAEVTLAPEQGWFEPDWIPAYGGRPAAVAVPVNTRPCVVVPLPATWEALRSRLKRNVKESIRRGANRLRRDGHSWRVTGPMEREGVDRALDTIFALHRARAALAAHVPHPEYFADRADAAFARDVARRLLAAGAATAYLLEVDGTPVAGRLVLHANRVSYFFSLAGFDPAWWHHGVATTLMAECLRLAIARGDILANLSIGPNTAKLRWSEEVRTYHDFVLVSARRRSRLAAGAYLALRTARRTRAVVAGGGRGAGADQEHGKREEQAVHGHA